MATTQNTQQDVKMLKDEIEELKAQLAEQAKAVSADKAEKSKESIQAAAKEAGRSARAFVADSRQHAAEAKDACEGTIKKHPFTSTALAFAGGALLTALLRRH